MRLAVSSSFLVATLFLPFAARAGQLDDVKHEIRPSGGGGTAQHGETASRPTREGWSESRYSEGSGWYDDGAGVVAFYALTAPWSIPLLAAEPGATRDFAYARYPYADGNRGQLHLGPEVGGQFDKSWNDTDNPAPEGTQPYALQVASDGSYQLGGTWRTTVGARLQTPLRFEVDTTWSLYVEPLGTRTDTAWMGQSHVAYRFAQGEHVQFRTGVGYRQWTTPGGTSLGVDFMYGFDVFWGRPIVTSVTLNAGTLGGAFVAELRGTIGVTVGRAEIFAGYDHVAMQSTGDTGRGGVGLGGPVLGLRAWF